MTWEKLLAQGETAHHLVRDRFRLMTDPLPADIGLFAQNLARAHDLTLREAQEEIAHWLNGLARHVDRNTA